jgi:hypothetical protein
MRSSAVEGLMVFAADGLATLAYVLAPSWDSLLISTRGTGA